MYSCSFGGMTNCASVDEDRGSEQFMRSSHSRTSGEQSALVFFVVSLKSHGMRDSTDILFPLA